MSGEVQEVPVKLAAVIEKSLAVPEVLEIIASREPLESLITVAFTPRFAALMALARSFKLSPEVPLPVEKVPDEPDLVVSVKEEVDRVAVGLDSRSEYHAPVSARPLITTVCVPATVPLATDALRRLLSDEVAVRAARGPVSEFRFCMSVARASVAV